MILTGALIGPLALSFDRKVAFYKKWRQVFGAMMLPAIFYIVWDSWFTDLRVWSFNPAYTTGFSVFGLPIEEILFFFVVPYCCLFIYECVRVYFPRITETKGSKMILLAIGAATGVMAFFYPEKKYTFSTGLFSAVFIALLFVVTNRMRGFKSAAFIVSYGVILLPFLAVNGVLTALPVVIYNNAENLSARIFSIPVEDIFYGMLLVLMNVYIYEKLQHTRKK